MAAGTHWEWRAFGEVPPAFDVAFRNLEPRYPPQEVTDTYLWAPGMEVNVKFRTGAEGGLKFKRLLERDGDLEKWLENPDEVFPFPLSASAWAALEAALSPAGIRIPEGDRAGADRPAVESLLQRAGGRLVRVAKRRETRTWTGGSRRVLVERAEIREPEPCVSVALETGEASKRDLRDAVSALSLASPALEVMNYMAAVERWARRSI